jgi:hypothetical protein
VKKKAKHTLDSIGEQLNKLLGDPAPPGPPTSVPCDCTEWCVGKASGTMGYCEDGIWREIAPPTVNSVLKFNASSGVPYWNAE